MIAVPAISGRARGEWLLLLPDLASHSRASLTKAGWEGVLEHLDFSMAICKQAHRVTLNQSHLEHLLTRQVY